MLKNIYLALFILVLASCDRAVNTETTKLKLVVPSSASTASAQQFIQNITTLSFEESAEGENFLEILPSGFDSGGAAPVNCYLVGVGGPEAFMNVNHCGAVQDDGTITTDYLFGPHVGLVPAGSDLELEVPSGKFRKVYLFGLHAVDSDECKSLLNSPRKNSLSFPHLVGSSGLLDLSSPQVTVNINLQNPSETSRLGGCTITKSNTEPEIADTIALQQTQFPYNVVRATNLASGNVCQNLDFNLLRDVEKYKPGALPSDATFSIKFTQASSETTKVNFASYAECANNVNPRTSFTIPAGKVRRNYWVQLVSSDASVSNIKAADTNSVISSTVGTVALATAPATEYAYDVLGLPRVLVKGQCYPIKLGIRNLYGTFPAAVAPSSSIFTVSSPTDGATGSVYANPTCNSTSTNTVSFITNQSLTTDYSIRMDADANPNEVNFFSIVRTSGPVIYSTKIPFKVVDSYQSTSYFSKLEYVGLTQISRGDGNQCIPITVLYQDQHGLPFVTRALDQGTVVAGPNTVLADLALYNDSTCTTNLAVGSNLTIGAGKVATTIYLGVPAGASLGARSIKIKINLFVEKVFEFTINGL